MQKIPIKNPQQEIQLMESRAFLGLCGICILLLLLSWRLIYLQIAQHHIYNTLSTKNWLDLVPIEPTRGLIYDRNGVLLAENIPVFSLDVLPYLVKNLKETLTEINKIVALSENDLAQFYKQLKQHRRFEEIPLKLRLSESEVARFTERQHQFPGVMVKARLIRHYPYGSSFSHVLGYVGRINSQELAEIDQINYSASYYLGKLGIEKYYEEELHGKVGYQEVENNAAGKPIRTLNDIKGTPGKNLYLTIDSQLQIVAEKALGGHRGAIVAIAPNTGQVLAMVSSPSFNPNGFVIGMSQKEYQALHASPDKPLYNRAVRGLYPLASTIKPFLALQALDKGVVTEDYTIYDLPYFQLKENSHKFYDGKKLGHGEVNLSKAISSSCNIFFYEIAAELGIKNMAAILSQFGFGALSGIDLEDEVTGILATPEWKVATKKAPWYQGDTILSAIGQGYMQTTPLQLAAAAVALATRGQRFIPTLLLAEQTPGGESLYQQPLLLETINLQNPKYWEIVISAMQNVVKIGTARRFGPHAYTVAAKTGTAQVSRRQHPDEEDKQENLSEHLRDHHLFITFAPVDKPKIALAIVTENSNSAIETARIILDYYLEVKDANRSPQNKNQQASR